MRTPSLLGRGASVAWQAHSLKPLSFFPAAKIGVVGLQFGGTDFRAFHGTRVCA
jgi:hypothetical protein